MTHLMQMHWYLLLFLSLFSPLLSILSFPPSASFKNLSLKSSLFPLQFFLSFLISTFLLLFFVTFQNLRKVRERETVSTLNQHKIQDGIHMTRVARSFVRSLEGDNFPNCNFSSPWHKFWEQYFFCNSVWDGWMWYTFQGKRWQRLLN